jgi:hypothetical protein
MRLGSGDFLHFTEAAHKFCHDIRISPLRIVQFREVPEATSGEVNPEEPARHSTCPYRRNLFFEASHLMPVKPVGSEQIANDYASGRSNERSRAHGSEHQTPGDCNQERIGDFRRELVRTLRACERVHASAETKCEDETDKQTEYDRLTWLSKAQSIWRHGEAGGEPGWSYLLHTSMMPSTWARSNYR